MVKPEDNSYYEVTESMSRLYSYISRKYDDELRYYRAFYEANGYEDVSCKKNLEKLIRLARRLEFTWNH